MKTDLVIKTYPLAVYRGNIWAGRAQNALGEITTCGAISTLAKPKNQ